MLEESEKLPWPPTEVDLRRLYLDQKLSAMKISRLYGLKYPNPKSGESMILYYLKRFGIKRRDKAEHIRKVTEEMVDEWVRRYQAGESLKQIAEGKLSPVTVFLHLRKRGVQLRDKIEALIKTITKHPKTPFSGDPMEKAYLIGFAQGDLYVTRHGRAIRVKTGTTRPAMGELFKQLFGNYGFIRMSPREAKLVGYEWSLEVDLDRSFTYLLERRDNVPKWIIEDSQLFFHYLAGFFDAEGSILMHRKHHGTVLGFEVAITNTNSKLLSTLSKKLSNLGYSTKVGFAGYSKLGNAGRPVWRLMMWRRGDVELLLSNLPVMHSEKIRKRTVALKLTPSAPAKERGEIQREWSELVESLEQARLEFLDQAKRILESKKSELHATRQRTRTVFLSIGIGLADPSSVLPLRLSTVSFSSLESSREATRTVTPLLLTIGDYPVALRTSTTLSLLLNSIFQSSVSPRSRPRNATIPSGIVARRDFESGRATAVFDFKLLMPTHIYW